MYIPYIRISYRTVRILYMYIVPLQYGTVRYGTIRCRTVSVPYGSGSGTVANLMCSSYRVSCACEPYVLLIPNGISRKVRHTTVVRIRRLSCFFFRLVVASVSTIHVFVSSFRAIFFSCYISTSIRKNPSTFFQNTYMILVRQIFFIFFSHLS